MGLQSPARARRISRWLWLVPALLVLGACSQQDQETWQRGGMPDPASDRSDATITLWQWSWVAALVIGVLVWGLIIFVMIRFRRRSDDEVPVQTRYNLPMEVLYTIAPVIVVLVLFKFVIDAQGEVTAEVEDPDHVIKVVGQQWSWTFNYIDDPALGGNKDAEACPSADEAVDDADATCVFQPGTPGQLPTLVLPVGESVRFELSSPDVIHSFWVPAFTYKLDVIPGKDNAFTMTPTRTGTFAGKCAELCGVYHSRMLFEVKVVTPAEFATALEDLRERGYTGVALGGSEVTVQDGLEPDEVDGETGISQ